MGIALKREPMVAAGLTVIESPATTLRANIISRHARVGVIGLGYVGLPLGAAFAEAGFNLTGFDIDPVRVATINGGAAAVVRL